MLERIIRDRLPANWNAELEVGQRPDRPDAVLRVTAPDGTSAQILVEAKTGIHPRDTIYVAEQLGRYGSGPKLVVAPFLSPRTQVALTERDIGFVDTTGNIRLALDEPAVFIRERGQDMDPWRDERSIRSLKGPTAGRVVRAICDFRPPYGVRELAERSGAAPASVSRVLTFLDPEGFVTRNDRGRVEAVDWRGLIVRWAQDYSFMKSNTTYGYLEPRGMKALFSKLATFGAEGPLYSVTGSVAATVIAPFASLRLMAIYAESADRLGEDLGLRPAESAVNVLIAEPFDRVVFDRTWERDGIRYAGLSQVAADLLTSPGRAPSEGEELLKWMQENENEWRS